tara:strand:- start:724 stop:1416 length:693 start_codon:yes stop_codon:yes gene_type:complete
MKRQRGFTLIEVVIALGIMVLLTSIALPSLNNLSRAELRKTSRMLMGLIRSTYDAAALSGRIHRIVFDIEGSKIKVESTGATLAIDSESNAMVMASSGLSSLSESLTLPSGESIDVPGDGASESELSESSAALQGLFGMSSLMGAGGTESFEPTEDVFVVPSGVTLMDIWTQNMQQPLAEGEASLYFFPNGFTQDALIHIQNESGQVFTVKVYALTGRTRVYAEYIEVDK